MDDHGLTPLDVADAYGVAGINPKGFTLASGRESYWYVNWRAPLSNVRQVDTIVGLVLDRVEALGLDVDLFVPVPSGTNQLATILNYTLGMDRADQRLCMIRETPKEHGAPQDRFYVGAPDGNVLVVEDVTTTGESTAKKALDRLVQTPGVHVVGTMALTHRREYRPSDRLTVARFLEAAYGVTHYWLTEGPQLLERAWARQKHAFGTQADRVRERLIEENERWGEIGIELE